jgi:hypothetical protein
MNTEHPITPPPELVQQWRAAASNVPATYFCEGVRFDYIDYIATRAAQWGADQELEACRMEIIDGAGRAYINETCNRVCLADDIWSARRPKPPSLKEQALAVLPERLGSGFMATINDKELDILRRAIEALPND